MLLYMYGKKYVDAWNRGDLIVGMHNGNVWHSKVVYSVWVRNGKVSNVRHY